MNTSSHLHVYQVIPSFTFSDDCSVCASRPLQCLLPSPAVFLLLLIFHDWHKLLENLSVNLRIIIEMELEVVWGEWVCIGCSCLKMTSSGGICEHKIKTLHLSIPSLSNQCIRLLRRPNALCQEAKTLLRHVSVKICHP